MTFFAYLKCRERVFCLMKSGLSPSRPSDLTTAGNLVPCQFRILYQAPKVPHVGRLPRTRSVHVIAISGVVTRTSSWPTLMASLRTCYVTVSEIQILSKCALHLLPPPHCDPGRFALVFVLFIFLFYFLCRSS